MSGRRLLIADRLIDGTGAPALPEHGVLIDGGRIVAIGPAAAMRASDIAEEAYPGCTILPGLIDSHVHLELSAAADHDVTRQAFEADRLEGRLAERVTRNAQAALASGVTTLRDCGSTLAVFRVRNAIQGGAPGPRILAAGPPVTTTRGHCHWWGGEADTLDQVLAEIRERADAGTDVVKIMTTGGIMTPESDPHKLQYDEATLVAAVEEAHRLGLKVVVHALAAAAVAAAHTADVDSIDHAGWATPDGRQAPDQALIEAIGRAHRAVGLTASGIVRRELDLGEEGVAALRERMRDKAALIAAGARVHVHSDAGVRFTPFDRPDLSLAAAAIGTGMSPVKAIAAMTGVAADVLGLGDEVGTLRAGLRADMLVVEGDAGADLAAIRRVRNVWRDGNSVGEVDARA